MSNEYPPFRLGKPRYDQVSGLTKMNWGEKTKYRDLTLVTFTHGLYHSISWKPFMNDLSAAISVHTNDALFWMFIWFKIIELRLIPFNGQSDNTCNMKFLTLVKVTFALLFFFLGGGAEYKKRLMLWYWILFEWESIFLIF